ncbi:hypothetical protein RDn1_213 [Candidatus Termititenax dinenymphae]|uniref:Uncharacterized protein n=1 Tax=Candidatus Termititenax dinenymphae TaxID=2218523 RepID=A0A388TLK4_9BACT|nr:hypothetical protein RDn1_213 [Candidatus Termititenax dinenymphae]
MKTIKDNKLVNLERHVREIIASEEIKSGYIFDTHTIILLLLQKYHDEYLNSRTARTTKAYHSRISKIVDTLATRIGTAYSKNVTDHFSKNACWKK